VVDKRHIVTNHHVVEDAERLFALNGGSNGPVELSVVEVVAGSGMARSDLALLRSEDDLNLPAFAVVPFPSEMDPVFAAGYPGAVLDTDENYRRLLQGDLGAIPGIVITNGRVSAIQNRDKPHSLLVHSAEISPGNSGGPLVDECGRVVGINTFLTNPTEGNPGNRAVYYSQPIARMLDAFGDTGVEFRVLEGICGSATAQQVHAGPAPDAQTDGE
jgi:S1-C subfamily serine protease